MERALKHIPTALVIGWGFLKGALVAAVTFLIGTAFWQSLIIAAVSGGLGMVGMIVAAYVTTKEARENREILRDLKHSMGVARRRQDEAQ